MKCEKLDVWKKALNLTIEVYKYFKECKDYGFKDQITRSSLSIVSNIAEGAERFSNNEKIRFFEIAIGSLAEFQTQSIIAKEINYIDEDIFLKWLEITNEIHKMLIGLIKNFKRV
jgi:four helix bundle protein